MGVYNSRPGMCLRFRRLGLELREENVQDQEENQIQMKGMGKKTDSTLSYKKRIQRKEKDRGGREG